MSARFVKEVLLGELFFQIAHQIGSAGKLSPGQGGAQLGRKFFGRAGQLLEHLLHHLHRIQVGVALQLLDFLGQVRELADGLTLHVLGLELVGNLVEVGQGVGEVGLIELFDGELDGVGGLADGGLGLLGLERLLLLVSALLQEAEEIFLGQEEDTKDGDEPSDAGGKPTIGRMNGEVTFQAEFVGGVAGVAASGAGKRVVRPAKRQGGTEPFANSEALVDEQGGLYAAGSLAQPEQKGHEAGGGETNAGSPQVYEGKGQETVKQDCHCREGADDK